MALSAKLLALLLLGTVLVHGQDAPEPPAKPELPEPAEPAWDPLPEREWNRGGWTRQGRTTFGENIVVRTNETAGDLVLIGGSVDIQGDVQGDVVAIGASVNV